MPQPSSRVPKSHDFNELFIGFDSIDDSVGSVNQLPQVGLTEFRDDSAHFRKLRQKFGARDELVTDASGRIWIVACM